MSEPPVTKNKCPDCYEIGDSIVHCENHWEDSTVSVTEFVLDLIRKNYPNVISVYHGKRNPNEQ